VDTDGADDIAKRLAGLEATTSSWRHAAREILLLANFRAGNIKAADEQASLILADPATPAALRTRIVIVSAQLQSMLPAAAN
jgi:hypothetical protein